MAIPYSKNDVREFVGIPIFEDVEVRFWIDWMDWKFSQLMVSDLQKLNLATRFIDGAAAAYVQQRHSLLPFYSWIDLRTALLLRFGDDDDPEKIIFRERNHQFLERCHQRKAQRDAAKNQVSPQPLEPGRSVGMRGSNEMNRRSLDSVAMPIFSGKYPFGWISQAERCFRLGGFSEEKMFELVSISLEGYARVWFTETSHRFPFMNWTSFKGRLIAQFGNVKAPSTLILKKPVQEAEVCADTELTQKERVHSISEEDSSLETKTITKIVHESEVLVDSNSMKRAMIPAVESKLEEESFGDAETTLQLESIELNAEKESMSAAIQTQDNNMVVETGTALVHKQESCIEEKYSFMMIDSCEQVDSILNLESQEETMPHLETHCLPHVEIPLRAVLHGNSWSGVKDSMQQVQSVSDFGNDVHKPEVVQGKKLVLPQEADSISATTSTESEMIQVPDSRTAKDSMEHNQLLQQKESFLHEPVSVFELIQKDETCDATVTAENWDKPMKTAESWDVYSYKLVNVQLSKVRGSRNDKKSGLLCTQKQRKCSKSWRFKYKDKRATKKDDLSMRTQQWKMDRFSVTRLHWINSLTTTFLHPFLTMELVGAYVLRLTALWQRMLGKDWWFKFKHKREIRPIKFATSLKKKVWFSVVSLLCLKSMSFWTTGFWTRETKKKKMQAGGISLKRSLCPTKCCNIGSQANFPNYGGSNPGL